MTDRSMGSAQRSNAFLREMGVGPRWLLRDRVHAQAAQEAELAAGEEVAAFGVMTAVAGAQAVAPTMPAAPALVAEPAAVAAPAVVAEPAAPVPVSARVPSPAPAPATPDKDTAWFDDAPAPPPKAPTLKQPAPPRPKAAAPQAADEDTAWFDAVPAAPVARASARGAATDAEIAAMDWPELQAAVRSCTRCRLCETRRAAVPGQGDENARWLVLGTAPTRADEAAEQPFSGAPGKLLHNMLQAAGLSAQRGAYVGTLVKCRPVADDGGERLPAADELAACRPYLQRELALTGAGLALTLGGVTAKGLLGMAARGKVLRYEGPGGDLPVVATFHPADLLKKPEDKARAWADLCLARSAHAGRR